jgi:hypothetical protein
MERFDVLGLHGLLLGVTSEFLCFCQVAGDLRHLSGMITKHQTQFLTLQRARECPLRLLDITLRWVSDSRGDKYLKVARRCLTHARVLREKTFLFDEVGSVSDLISRDVWRVWVVG